MTRATILALCTVSFAFAQDFTGEWVASWRIPGSSRQLVLNLAHDRKGAGRMFTRGAEFALPAQAASADAGSWFTLPAPTGRAVMAAGSETKWTTVAQ